MFLLTIKVIIVKKSEIECREDIFLLFFQVNNPKFMLEVYCTLILTLSGMNWRTKKDVIVEDDIRVKQFAT